MKIESAKPKKNNGMKTAILFFSIMAVTSWLLVGLECTKRVDRLFEKSVPNDTTIKKPVVVVTSSNDNAISN